jgi:hypothetical protein
MIAVRAIEKAIILIEEQIKERNHKKEVDIKEKQIKENEDIDDEAEDEKLELIDRAEEMWKLFLECVNDLTVP